jgi:hypothetical protein
MSRRIISASRRTDIPAFYSRWLLRRLEEGSCDWITPFGSRRFTVSLRPEDCLAIVFWTRNPSPLVPALAGIRAAGHFFYFQFTVTGYGRPLETHAPPLDVSLRHFRRLASEIGPEAIVWRYDPVVVSSSTPPALHVERFERIAGALRGATRRACISFVDYYGKTRRGFEAVRRESGIAFVDPATPERRDLALRLRDIAARNGMSLSACCEDEVVDPAEGIEKGRCVDIEIVRHLRPDVPDDVRRRPSREGCGCTESVDIGAYDTCPFGCSYCYATRGRELALARARRHDPRSSLLAAPVSPVLARLPPS